MNAKVDVLRDTETRHVLATATQFTVFGILSGFLRNGREFVPRYNIPRSTGLIANNARHLRTLSPGPSTAQTLRALRALEREGLIECCGTGAEHNRAFNKSAAAERELYWRLTDAALKAVQP